MNLIGIIALITLNVTTIPAYSPWRNSSAQTPQTLLISNNIDTDPFSLMKEESLGKLTIELPANQVIQLIGNPLKKDQKVVWGADGLYHQNWYYPNQGITLNMVSDTEKGLQTIFSIKLASPSTLETKRGMKIGSSVEEVIRTYGKDQEQETSVSGQSFVAGSIYGGLIFTFENGLVNEIFLGAAAE